MKHRPFFTVFFLLTFSVLQAQLGGRNVFEFLNLPSSPRSAALGGKVITVFDQDPSSAFFNPATINPEMDNQLAVNYVSHLAGINYGTASYAYLLDRRFQVLHGGVTYINYGSFDGFDEQGNATGSFGAFEAALSVGYAYNFYQTDFYVGGNVKLINSKFDNYTSFGGAVDLGVFYDNPYSNIRAALALRNIGFQIVPFADERETLPFEIILGFSQKIPGLNVRYHITIDNLQQWDLTFNNPATANTNLDGQSENNEPGFFNNALRHTIVGVELFTESFFQLRFGYNFRRAEELRTEGQRSFSGLNGGFELDLGSWRISYTHSRFSNVTNTNLFGLHINLSGDRY